MIFCLRNKLLLFSRHYQTPCRLPGSALQVPLWVGGGKLPTHYKVKLQLMLRLVWAVTILPATHALFSDHNYIDHSSLNFHFFSQILHFHPILFTITIVRNILYKVNKERILFENLISRKVCLPNMNFDVGKRLKSNYKHTEKICLSRKSK